MNLRASLLALALLSIALPAYAGAPEDAVEQAKGHFHRGVTLYAEQWERLLDNAVVIREFLKDNANLLSVKA